MIKTVVLVSWWALSFTINSPISPAVSSPNQAAKTNLHAASTKTANLNTTSNTAALKEQLEIELRVRRPSEFAFIAHVIQRVDNNSLPRSLVEGTFLWARKHETHRFQYFERGLRRRAAELGIQL